MWLGWVRQNNESILGALVCDGDADDRGAGVVRMFHLILHVYYKSGAKRAYYMWDYESLIIKVKKLQGNDRIERYEVEDRHETDKKRWLGSV